MGNKGIAGGKGKSAEPQQGFGPVPVFFEPVDVKTQAVIYIFHHIPFTVFSVSLQGDFFPVFMTFQTIIATVNIDFFLSVDICVFADNTIIIPEPGTA